MSINPNLDVSNIFFSDCAPQLLWSSCNVLSGSSGKSMLKASFLVGILQFPGTRAVSLTFNYSPTNVAVPYEYFTVEDVILL